MPAPSTPLSTALIPVRQDPSLIGQRSRFDGVSMALHWLTVLLILVLFVSAWSIERVPDAATRLLTLHRSTGVVLLLVAPCRLAWRWFFAVRPPLPASMPRPQRIAAALSEAALYLFVIAQPLTGLGQSLARGKPFQLFVFQAPVLMVRDRPLAMLLHNIHELGAWVMLALIGAHVAAALFHGLVRRDGVLGSMWPWPLKRAGIARRP